MLRFEVECHTVVGEHVAVCGSGPLGDWDVNRCVILEPSKFPIWTGCVTTGHEAVEFKYILISEPGPSPKFLRWECTGENRRAQPDALGATKPTLRHRFGEPQYEAVAVTGVTDMTAKDCGEEDGTEAGSSILSSLASFSSLFLDGGVLDALEVSPSVRLARVVVSPTAFMQKYDLNEQHVLGEGMSGKVCVATVRATGAEVAVKTLSICGASEEQREQMRTEVRNHLTMDHPNICRLVEVFEEPDRLRLVMERMRGPNLHGYLLRRGTCTEREAAAIMRQMCDAVAYCHANGICHRDVKLENFCMEDNTKGARVKMIDFGISSVSVFPMTKLCGTLHYMAPEVLSQSYSDQCDMWSLGVIAYILLDGHAPFWGHDDCETLQLIQKGSYRFRKEHWNHLSPEARDFVSSLLQVDVSRRLDAQSASAHPWLKDISDPRAGNAPMPCDVNALHTLNTITQSKALKGAMLRAAMPAVAAEKVIHWTKTFEKLDVERTGNVAAKDLASYLTESGEFDEAEINSVSAALGIPSRDGVVSYSTFLVTCLAAHITLRDCNPDSSMHRDDAHRLKE